MNIQSYLGVSALQGIGKVFAQSSGNSVQGDVSGSAGTASVAEQASISDAAKNLFASENPIVPKTPEQERLMNMVRSDPADADKMAQGLAYTRSQILYDISSGEVRLASTKQIPTKEQIQQFEQEALGVNARLRELYAAEKAKGTDPVQILSKIIDFKNVQSASYLEMTGWGMV